MLNYRFTQCLKITTKVSFCNITLKERCNVIISNFHAKSQILKNISKIIFGVKIQVRLFWKIFKHYDDLMQSKGILLNLLGYLASFLTWLFLWLVFCICIDDFETKSSPKNKRRHYHHCCHCYS